MDLLERKPVSPYDITFNLIRPICENTYNGSELRLWICHAAAYTIPYLKGFNPFTSAGRVLQGFSQEMFAALVYVGGRGSSDGIIPVVDKRQYHVLNKDGTWSRRDDVEGE